MPKGDKDILKADPEDGTTPISNLLLEAVAMAKLSGLAKGLILYLWRRTYGWQSEGKRLKERKIPLAEWSNALDSTKARVSATLTLLEKSQIIKRKPLGMGKSYIYSMNTRISEWNGCLNVGLLSKTVTVTENVTVAKNRGGTVTQNDNTTVTENITPIDTKLALPKERLKKVKESNNNNDINLILDFIKDNFPKPITKHIADELSQLHETYPGWLLEALKTAVENGKPTVAYAKGILKDWAARGFKAEKPVPARQGRKPIPKLWPNSECKISLSGFFVGKNKYEN